MGSREHQDGSRGGRWEGIALSEWVRRLREEEIVFPAKSSSAGGSWGWRKHSTDDGGDKDASAPLWPVYGDEDASRLLNPAWHWPIDTSHDGDKDGSVPPPAVSKSDLPIRISRDRGLHRMLRGEAQKLDQHQLREDDPVEDIPAENVKHADLQSSYIERHEMGRLQSVTVVSKDANGETRAEVRRREEMMPNALHEDRAVNEDHPAEGVPRADSPTPHVDTSEHDELDQPQQQFAAFTASKEADEPSVDDLPPAPELRQAVEAIFETVPRCFRWIPSSWTAATPADYVIDEYKRQFVESYIEQDEAGRSMLIHEYRRILLRLRGEWLGRAALHSAFVGPLKKVWEKIVFLI